MKVVSIVRPFCFSLHLKAHSVFVFHFVFCFGVARLRRRVVLAEKLSCRCRKMAIRGGGGKSLDLSGLINTDMLLFLKCHGEGPLNKTSVSHHKRNLPENEPERNPRETSALRVTDPSSNLSYIKSHKHPQRSKIEAGRHLLHIRKAAAAFALQLFSVVYTASQLQQRFFIPLQNCPH